MHDVTPQSGLNCLCQIQKPLVVHRAGAHSRSIIADGDPRHGQPWLWPHHPEPRSSKTSSSCFSTSWAGRLSPEFHEKHGAMLRVTVDPYEQSPCILAKLPATFSGFCWGWIINMDLSLLFITVQQYILVFDNTLVIMLADDEWWCFVLVRIINYARW